MIIDVTLWYGIITLKINWMFFDLFLYKRKKYIKAVKKSPKNWQLCTVGHFFGIGWKIGKVDCFGNMGWLGLWSIGKCCFHGLEMFMTLLLPLYWALFCVATTQLYRPLQDIFQHRGRFLTKVFSAILQRTGDETGRFAGGGKAKIPSFRRKQKFQLFCKFAF